MSAVDERLDQRLHVAYVFRGPGLDIGTTDIQAVHVLMEGGNVGFGNFRAGLALTVGPGNDLVVHVGKIADKGHVVAEMTQIPVQHVEHHRRACMTDMTEVVGRDAAGVHADLAGMARLEIFLAACHGIIQLHGFLPYCCLCDAVPGCPRRG